MSLQSGFGDIATGGVDDITQDINAAALKRRSVRGAALTFGAQAARAILQFGSQIAMAHLLAPTAFGLLAMVAPVMSLVQIFNELGLTQATVQRTQISHRELSALFWVNVGVSSVLAVLLALTAPVIAWLYGEPRLQMVTVALAGLLVFSGISAQQMALMNRRMQFFPLAVIDVGCMVIAVAVGIAAAWAGLGYWSLVLMQAANSFTIMLLAWVLSDWRPSRPRFDTNIGALLRFGGHLTGFNILGYVENNLGNVLIGGLQGPVALGLYDRAFKLVIVPWWQINLPVARVAVALLSRLRGDEANYIRAAHRMLQGLLLAAAPGLVWAALLSGLLVPKVLGANWADAAPIVTWLALATTLVPFGACGYWLFVSQDRVRQQLRYALISGASIIASIVIGIHWGAVGVARTYAAFAIVTQGASLWGATRSGPVRLPGVLKAVAPIVAAVAVAGFVVSMTDGLMADAGSPELARIAATLCLAYGTTATGLLCSRAGARILRDMWDLRATFRAAPKSV